MQQGAYVHSKPNGDVFYVGKGPLSRTKSLSPKQRNIAHKHTVAKYGAENIGIGYLECSSEATAFELEVGLIKCFRRMGASLVNMTNGGEGKSGCPNSPEAYALTAAKNRGQKRSQDFCQRVSERMRGRAVSEQTRAKIRKAVKAQPLSEAFKAQWGTRKGALNGKARAVIGSHPEYGVRRFATLTEAAKCVNGHTSKVWRSIKLGHKHKGWSFMYEVNK